MFAQLIVVVWAVALGAVAVSGVAQARETAEGVGRGTALVGLNGSAIHALSGFALHLVLNGDRKVKSLGAELRTGQARGWIRDDSGQDRVQLRVEYEGGYRGRIMRPASVSDCRQTCYVPIERPRPGETFVLNGFSFNRPDGARNIASVEVWPIVEEGRIRVALLDRAHRGKFEVRIHYSYLELPERWRSVSHGARSPKGKFANLSSEYTGVRLLQGFSFESLVGGDKHLRSLSLRTAQKGGYVATFFDQSPSDDRYEVKVMYVTDGVRRRASPARR